jgi:competence protein ComEC
MQGRSFSAIRVPYLLLAWCAGAWCAGIGAAAMFGADAWPLAIATGGGALAMAMVRRNPMAAACAVVLPAIFLAGVAREQMSHRPMPDDAVAHYNDGVAMRIRGVLRDDPDVGDTSQRFAISVREIQRAGDWHEASGGVLVRTPLLPEYRAGDMVELEGKLETPPRLQDFDYAAYLARRGIGSVMEYPEARTVGHDEPSVVRRILLNARRTLSDGLALSLPEPQAALAQGVLLGERSALPADVRDDLNATNTSHLVVVSGGNVVLVSMYSTLLFGLVLRRRWAVVLSIAVVVAYAALVGLSPPVFRATVMGIVLILAQVSGRRSNGLTSLLLAAAIMCGLQPSVLADVSFQLSFAATAGILYLATPLRRGIIDAMGAATGRTELPRWLGAAFVEPAAVTLAAMLATAPLLALNFERVSLVALPANLLIVPAFPFILGASFIAAVGGTLPVGHLVLGTPAYALLSYWLGVASWFAALPGAAAVLDGYTRPWALATYAAAITIAVVTRRTLLSGGLTRLAPSRPMRWRVAARRGLYVAPAFLLVVSAGWLANGASNERRLEVTVLDVGQGDAILIETPSGRDVLVDGGPGRAVLRGLGDELAWNDRALDLVIVTHTQSDHALGLLDVLDRYDVRRVAHGAPADDSMLARRLAAAVDAEGAVVQDVGAGDWFDLGDGLRLDVLSPPPARELDEGNDASVVLRLVFGKVSFLLTGDVEAGAERAIAENGAEVASTVLKVAHHGSATSSTRAFLDAVQPSVAVISSGAENQFGHPHKDVVGRLDDYAAIFNTAERGAVHFETDGERLWIETDD